MTMYINYYFLKKNVIVIIFCKCNWNNENKVVVVNNYDGKIKS